MKLTIFHSWQSDTDQKSNRYLVRDALELACKQLDYSLELDEATRNVPGSPSIVDSILRKITRSAVVVADLTLVGKYSDKKHTVNPNVLIEYGYALHALGEERIIGYMNGEYGGPENLPFDLRFRAVRVQYNLPAKPELAETRVLKKQLASQLSREIRLVLSQALFEGLSSASIAAVELFITKSEVGAFGRPSFDFAEFCALLGIDPSVGQDVVDELEARGLLKQTIGIVEPTDSLFWSFDKVFRPWNPEADARSIAEKLVEEPTKQLAVEKIAAEFGWEVRRINPALTFLMQHGLVGYSREIRYPWVVFSIQETGVTRQYVKNQ